MYEANMGVFSTLESPIGVIARIGTGLRGGELCTTRADLLLAEVGLQHETE